MLCLSFVANNEKDVERIFKPPIVVCDYKLGVICVL